MMARDPALEQYRNGMEPGIDQPLGARAPVSLSRTAADTLYRLHGTKRTLVHRHGHVVGNVSGSSNQDIIDLYGRVPLGSQFW